MKPYQLLPAVTVCLSGFIQTMFISLLSDLKMAYEAKLVNTRSITNTILACQIIGSLLGLRIYKIWGPKVALLLSDIIYIICSLSHSYVSLMDQNILVWDCNGTNIHCSSIFSLQSSPHQLCVRLKTIVDISALLGSSALYFVETIDAPTIYIHIILHMTINPLDQMLTGSDEKCSLNLSYDKLSYFYLRLLK